MAARFGTKWGTGAERREFGNAHWREPGAWDVSAARRGVRERVFCSSMADVFEDRRDLDAPRERLWALITATPALDWLLLTKRPQHIAAMLPATLDRANVWLGVTAEDQRRADERIAEMLRHDAAHHFVSYEPGIGPVDFTRLDFAPPMRNPSPNDPIVRLDALRGLVTGMDEKTDRRVSWVIVGGESGPGARPFDLAWARSVVGQCAQSGTKAFFKQAGSNPMLDGERLGLRERSGRDLSELPADLHVREFPDAVL